MPSPLSFFCFYSYGESTQYLFTAAQKKKGIRCWWNRLLPVDHPSICWRTLKNSVISAVNVVLYHETVGMYPIVFGNYYTRLLVIHRLVTPVTKEEEKRWILHCFHFGVQLFGEEKKRSFKRNQVVVPCCTINNANHRIEIFWFFFATSWAELGHVCDLSFTGIHSLLCVSII